jgi:hypothetical protein
MIIRCAGMQSKTISPAIALMTSNYHPLRPNDVNAHKPSGNRATGNTKSAMTETSKNIAITSIGIR